MKALLHRIVAIGLICLLAGGCTSTQALARPVPAQAIALVKPGDQVDCTLRNGTDLKFKVVRVEADVLVGDKQRVSVHDLTYLKVKRFSAGKTLLLVAGLVATGFIAGGVAEMGALGFPTTTP
jgi:hypothetical protein